ncbi:MAG TPA: MauE/DoxX family redox-associated membrane protein [Streptosporangiaceae bacterium]|nr:MauE/DoxX family redox-associated membrane protein [Streptosporangiaceae bacterium]
MTAVALACKAVVAVLLVAAGGAKLADLPGFAASVRLFLPGTAARRLDGRAAPRLDRGVALGIAAGEITAGAASLSSPRANWLNLVVLAICCGFVAVSAAGYRWHRGRSCRCFGALSRRRFNLAGLGRSMLIALGAGVATAPVRAVLIQLGPADRIGLLAGALLVAGAAFSAAAAVGAGRGSQDAQPGWA